MSIFSELNSELANCNVRYNAITDRLEVLLNGTWVETIKVYAQRITLFDENGFYATYANGSYQAGGGAWQEQPFTINLPTFIMPRYSTKYYFGSFVFEDAIDLTNYSVLVVKTSNRTYTVNITSINEEAYVNMYSYCNAQDGVGAGIGVSSQKEYYNDYELASTPVDISSNVTITEIYLE